MSNERKKVLFVGAFPPAHSDIVGGQVRACETLLRSEFSNYFEVQCVDTTQISNPPPGFLKRLWRALIRLFVYIHEISDFKPDSVIIFSAAGFSLLEKGLMVKIANLSKVPVLFFPRAGKTIDQYHKSLVHRIGIKWAFKGTDVCLAQGPAWQRFFVNELHFPISRTRVVFNWTATPTLLSVGNKRILSEPSKRPRILFLGWLERHKGILDLLRAVNLINDKSKVTLTVAGKGNAELEARHFVHQKGLSSNVEFSGWVRDDDLLRLFEEHDILVLPSWSEGFPNSVIEAMSAGLAVITTTVGEIPDILTDHKNSLLVPPRDIHALQFALEELLSDSGIRQEIQRAGHQFASRHFMLEAASDALICAVNSSIRTSHKVNDTR